MNPLNKIRSTKISVFAASSCTIQFGVCCVMLWSRVFLPFSRFISVYLSTELCITQEVILLIFVSFRNISDVEGSIEQTDRAIARTLQTCYDEEYVSQVQCKTNDMERREALDRTKKEQVMSTILICGGFLTLSIYSDRHTFLQWSTRRIPL